MIACGAIAAPIAEIVARDGWPVDVHPLPPLLHNHPEKIAAEIEPLLISLQARYETVAIGYADCGTYGAVDALCATYGVKRLQGLHCYDVYAGAGRMQRMFNEQPGSYVLTDFLVRSFRRTVIAELGMDRYPELRDDYFGHYTRIVWLAQNPDDELRTRAQEAAELLDLPLTVLDVGLRGLEASLRELLGPRNLLGPTGLRNQRKAWLTATASESADLPAASGQITARLPPLLPRPRPGGRYHVSSSQPGR